MQPRWFNHMLEQLAPDLLAEWVQRSAIIHHSAGFGVHPQNLWVTTSQPKGRAAPENY